MKIKPEERPTVIALGVAIGAVLLYGATHFLPDMLNGNKAAATQNGTANSSKGLTASPAILNTAAPLGVGAGNPSTPGIPGQNIAAGSKVSMYDDAVVEPTTTRDPFTPTGATLDMNPPIRPIIQTNILPTTRPGVRVFPTTPMVTQIRPTFPFPHTTPVPPSTGMMPGNDMNSQANQMVLAGVIAGPQAVAVIHIGDRAYPLMSGEKMPYNMSLGRITEDGAYVKQGKQTWFIQVGKSLSAAMGMKPAMEGFKAPGSMAPNTFSGAVRRVATATDEQAGSAADLVSPAASTAENVLVSKPLP